MWGPALAGVGAGFSRLSIAGDAYRLTYRLNPPRRGDVVMLYYPEDPEKSFVKRVIGSQVM